MTQYQIYISVAIDGPPPHLAAQLRHALAATLAQQGVREKVALTLVLTDDATVQELNATFRRQDKVTDVLSFPTEEHSAWPDTGRYLGDIIIAWPQTRRQAERAGHAVEAEALLLAVHGALHLLGHDHDTAEEKAAMWAAQATILQAIGAPLTEPADDD